MYVVLQRLAGLFSAALTFALALILVGCSRQLLGSLDEGAANQVVSALRLEGVSADKAPAGEKGWRVSVPDEQFADAVQILERRNLPAQQFQGLGQVFRKESLVSTPTEERARLMYAMSQELEHSLLEIDGVLAARVHPVILLQDPLNAKRSAATASVLIKYRVGIDVNSRETMARSLVAAGIEGLNYDDVRVVMVPAEARSAGSDRSADLVDATPAGSERIGHPRMLQQLSRQLPVYAGVTATVVALLVLMAKAWRRWRGGSFGTLRGRWEHTVNSMFLEREQPPGQGSNPNSSRGRWSAESR